MDTAGITNSARGWHGVQLAALAFIGFCGVLSEGDSANPTWLQVTAGVLALAALVVASVAVLVVAHLAWPLSGDGVTTDESRADRAPRRLRVGVALTFVAVALMALAALSSWWPTDADTGAAAAAAADAGSSTTAAEPAVEITDRAGNTACGRLRAGPAGAIRLATDDRTIDVALAAVADLEPVDTC